MYIIGHCSSINLQKPNALKSKVAGFLQMYEPSTNTNLAHYNQQEEDFQNCTQKPKGAVNFATQRQRISSFISKDRRKV